MYTKANYVVQKDHELVRMAINKFTHKQNQLMAILLGKYVHTKDKYCIDAEVSIDEFRQLMDLKSDGVKNYKRIKDAVESFAENSSVGIYTVENGKTKWVWRPYFAEITLDETTVKFKWNPAMYPDLLEFKNQWTGYLANDYLKLSSVYSQNLYEQMKSYQNMPRIPQITFTIDDLHRIMQTEKKKTYKNFNSFKHLVIARAIDDINEKTDIFVEFETVKDKKDKRKAIGLAFTIHSKNEKFNYLGCWLNGDEINDIFKRIAKKKITELAQIKKENQQYYTLLRQGNKSDYDIILNFIKKDEEQREKKAVQQEPIVQEWEREPEPEISEEEKQALLEEIKSLGTKEEHDREKASDNMNWEPVEDEFKNAVADQLKLNW